MGMFDYLKCEMPVPVDVPNDCVWQTKDFDCELEWYVIRADGSLVYRSGDPVAYTGDISFCAVLPDRWVLLDASIEDGKCIEITRSPNLF